MSLSNTKLCRSDITSLNVLNATDSLLIITQIKDLKVIVKYLYASTCIKVHI